MQEDAEEEFKDSKEKVERELEDQWQAEKQGYERELHEKHEGYNAIISQIEDSKDKVFRLEGKVSDLER